MVDKKEMEERHTLVQKRVRMLISNNSTGQKSLKYNQGI
jgi:hypothetical protein